MTDTVSPGSWRRLRATADPALRDRIVEANLPLVRSVAGGIMRRMGGKFDYDELVGMGCVGLLAAVDQYDPDLGFAFSTYALPRIRGAILDEIRRLDPSTRLSRRRRKEIAAAERTITARRRAAADAPAIAEEMSIDTETLHDWRSRIHRTRSVSLQEPVRPGAEGERTWADRLPDGPSDRIEAGIAFEEDAGRLADLILQLPERQRVVLHLYYYEQLPQARIAELLGVTESRISQIRTRTLAALRERFEPAGADARLEAGAHRSDDAPQSRAS